MLDVGGLREWLKLGTIAAFSFCLGIALSVAQQSWLHLSTPLWIAACVGLSVLYLYAIGQVLEILDHGESVDFVFIAALVWLLAFVFGLIVLPLVSGLYDLVETKMCIRDRVAPGDVVIVDRNCHKSILHAIMMTRCV